MKIQTLRKAVLLAAVACFAWRAWRASGQDLTSSASPPLPDAVVQVLKLEQAKINDATIIAYINNSGNIYGLNASQIIYLRQQGVSDAVLSAMLSQPKNSVPTANAPMPQVPPPSSITTPSESDSYLIPATTSAPAVTYVEAQPYYYPYNYYPYCGYSWGWPYNVSWSWRWYGGGRHWGWGGWHGGSSWNRWHGNAGWGWHGSGGWHGGGTWGGGGWHSGGGGGGWHH